jgi:hypothetical protein
VRAYITALQIVDRNGTSSRDSKGKQSTLGAGLACVFAGTVQLQARFDHVHGLQQARLGEATQRTCKETSPYTWLRLTGLKTSGAVNLEKLVRMRSSVSISSACCYAARQLTPTRSPTIDSMPILLRISARPAGIIAFFPLSVSGGADCAG